MTFVREAVMLRAVVGPPFERWVFDLDRDAARGTNEMMMMFGAFARAVGALSKRGLQDVDLVVLG